MNIKNTENLTADRSLTIKLNDADRTIDLTGDIHVAALVANSRQVISGGGLTGGGDLSADRTLVVGAGTGIAVNADDVAVNLSTLTNSLSADVDLNNTGQFFTGPTVAQGSTGTWWAAGTVTVYDSAGAASIRAKLWDGTTVIASAVVTTSGANATIPISLSGRLASPAGNIRISVQDGTSTNGKIAANGSGVGNFDSTLTVMRIV